MTQLSYTLSLACSRPSSVIFVATFNLENPPIPNAGLLRAEKQRGMGGLKPPSPHFEKGRVPHISNACTALQYMCTITRCKES